MEIKIDEETMNRAATVAAEQAVSSAFGSYGIQQKLGELIGSAAVVGAMAAEIEKEVEKIDMNQLAKALAAEVARAAVAATVALVRDSFASTIVDLRAKGHYLGDKERTEMLIAIKAEVFR